MLISLIGLCLSQSVVAVEAGGATSSSKASFSSRVSFNDLTELAGSAGASSFALAAAASGASSPTHKKQGSSDDLLRHGIVRGLRRGVFASVETISDLPRLFPIISAKVTISSHNAGIYFACLTICAKFII